MDRMLAVVFDNAWKAYEGKKVLRQLDDGGTICVYGAAVVTRKPDGTISVVEDDDWPLYGTIEGTAVGSLIGLLGGPVGLAIGAAAGLVAGAAADMNKNTIGEDFVGDVAKVLLPERVALVADIEEDLTAPVDIRMEAIGGTVFRRALSEVRHTIHEEHIAAMKADLAQLKAEHAKAQAGRKAKLQEKIDQLDSKLQAELQKAKDRREASNREAQAKAELLKTKAATAKAKAAETRI